VSAVRAPVLVLAVGNPSRGDDAIGPLLAERLEAAIAAGTTGTTGTWGPQVEVCCDAQLMVEHALDVVGRRAIIFVDAAASDPGRVAWAPVVPARGGLAVTTHSCSPGQLLRLVEGTLGEASPPSWLLSVGGHAFELGEPLHQETARALEVAWRRLVVELRALGVAVNDGDIREGGGA
jgi:hydrogenase maturation protease